MTVNGSQPPIERPDVPAVLARLKDFQRATVGHVFRRLYEDPDPTTRFLIADEVGLGKTLVAHGLVAKVVDQLWDDVPRIDVIYVCSNADIARQNISRLCLPNWKQTAHASRLTMLPKIIGGFDKKLNFVSFTPSTSFDLKSSMGTASERAILYWLLRDVWPVAGTGALNLLQGWAAADNFRWYVRQIDPDRDLDRGIRERFAAVLRRKAEEQRREGVYDLETRFRELCARLPRKRKYVAEEAVRGRSELIGELRAALALTCVEALEPDLIILDEFQRFRDLLRTDTPQGELAHHLFGFGEARSVLLSATPYKMLTLSEEAEHENHYADFLETLRFLFDGYDSRLATFEVLLEDYRQTLLSLGPATRRRLRELKQEIEEQLLRVMVRTERLAATVDRSGMLVERKPSGVTLESRDVRDYAVLQSVASTLCEHRLLNQDDVVEYWKSAPYLLNFMESYELKSALEKVCKPKGPSAEDRDGAQKCDGGVRECERLLAGLLARHPELLLNWSDIRDYARIDPANARLRSLMADTVDSGAWKLLWMPPALPYYRLRGAFAAPALRGFTKRLVFSSWAVVPKVVAGMLSYEAERQIFSAYEDQPQNTAEARRARSGLLRFVQDRDGRLTGMPILGWLYPCVSIAGSISPLSIAAGSAAGSAPAASTVLREAQACVEELLPGLEAWVDESQGADDRWYWAAPLLLDAKYCPDEAAAWFAQSNVLQAWAGDDVGDDEDDVSGSGFAAHAGLARDLVREALGHLHSESPLLPLGRMPRDLARYLSCLAVGGPTVSALRALARALNDPDLAHDLPARREAARCGWGVRSLFNSPESMAIVRGSYGDSRRGGRSVPYWRRIIDYCVDGCFQSVLDEYMHVAKDAQGVSGRPREEALAELGLTLRSAVSLRTSVVAVDDLAADQEAGRLTVARPTPRMRTHFALRFGQQRSEQDKEIARAAAVRDAFNSPFWPFVLASTSVGQEGLDFHVYCHAVVHWNLPPNPVDLEQREGRVHRFKGHAVRKNLARAYGFSVVSEAEEAGCRREHHDCLGRETAWHGDVWQLLFDRACADRHPGDSDLVPYWVYTGLAGTPASKVDRIERYVPVLPLSHDEARLEALRRSLAVYRMLIGHARQEELLAWLMHYVEGSGMSTADINELVQELTIDLSPRGGEQPRLVGEHAIGGVE